jgi:hypothetical protein
VICLVQNNEWFLRANLGSEATCSVRPLIFVLLVYVREKYTGQFKKKVILSHVKIK